MIQHLGIAPGDLTEACAAETNMTGIALGCIFVVFYFMWVDKFMH